MLCKTTHLLTSTSNPHPIPPSTLPSHPFNVLRATSCMPMQKQTNCFISLPFPHQHHQIGHRPPFRRSVEEKLILPSLSLLFAPLALIQHHQHEGNRVQTIIRKIQRRVNATVEDVEGSAFDSILCMYPAVLADYLRDRLGHLYQCCIIRLARDILMGCIIWTHRTRFLSCLPCSDDFLPYSDSLQRDFC